MRLALLVLGCAIATHSPAYAEIEKLATSCEERICFSWWPRLPVLDGWHHDRKHSLHYSANALAPDGFTFANAETVMYAKAIYKPRDPEIKSLEMLIERDRRDFAVNVSGVEIKEAAPLATADGKELKSLTFFPKSEGSWERVSYGEEGDFYLVFTISSRSRKSYDASLGVYERLIKNYREAP